MKVKQTVAAVCLAAIVATSIGASAYGAWSSSNPNSKVGAWDHGAEGNWVGAKIYSYFYPAEYGTSGAYAQANSGEADYRWEKDRVTAIATIKQDGYTSYYWGVIKYYNHYEYWSWQGK